LNPEQDEQIPGETAEFDLSEGDDAYCEVTNSYYEGRLKVNAIVVNDEGGTATVSDISIEVFRTDGTPVITATPCAANGMCLDTMLPIGDYAIGYVGPAGYTRQLVQVSAVPDAAERITDDPDAVFTLVRNGLVEIAVTIDDPTPPTTSTNATTTTNAGNLPPTGASTKAIVRMTLIALLLVGSGAALVATRRRIV
jgi:hypothetical protein